MTIFKKMLLLLLLVALIPMLVVGANTYRSAKHSLQHEIINRLESIAELKVKKINAYFNERKSDAYILSQSDYIKANLPRIGYLINNRNNPEFMQVKSGLDSRLQLYVQAYGYHNIMLVNPHGQTVYNTDFSHFLLQPGKILPAELHVFFGNSTNGTVFSGIYKIKKNDQSSYIIIAAPIKNSRNDFIGSIFLEIDLNDIFAIIKDKTGLGVTGETLIGKKTETGAQFLSPLLHSPADNIDSVAKGKNIALPLLEAVEGNIGSGISTDYRKQEVIAAWRPLKEMNWGMVVKIDTSEAFDPVIKMRNNILLFLIFIIIVNTLIALALTNRTIRPILNLTSTSKRVSEGDFAARASVITSDEIGELARNFNTMIDKLISTNDSLKEAQRIAQIGIWELDLATNVLTWSDEIYRIFEIDPKQFGANYESFLNTIHPDDRDAVNTAYTLSIKTQKPYQIDHRLLFSDGRIKYVHEQCESQFNDDNKPIRSVGTVQDITARKNAEEEIRELNRELERRVSERTAELETTNKELESFSYSVSHDLRAPLRSITGFAELLKNRIQDSLDEKSLHYLNIITESTTQMSGLIDDILSFSRMGRTEMMESLVDFSILTKNALKILDNETKGRTINWQIGTLPNSYGDPNMLQQVMTNLISNAVKFTSKREQAVIEIDAREDDNETVYFIRDNGAGFEMEHSNKLFGLFQRLHRMEDYPGNGVGLANVQRIIQRHGGRVWAEGIPDAGATFYFTLPKKHK